MNTPLLLCGIGEAATANFIKVRKAMDRIYAGTGATGAELEELNRIFRDVLPQVPNSADEVASVIIELNARYGISAGPDLAELIMKRLRGEYWNSSQHQTPFAWAAMRR